MCVLHCRKQSFWLLCDGQSMSGPISICIFLVFRAYELRNYTTYLCLSVPLTLFRHFCCQSTAVRASDCALMQKTPERSAEIHSVSLLEMRKSNNRTDSPVLPFPSHFHKSIYKLKENYIGVCVCVCVMLMLLLEFSLSLSLSLSIYIYCIYIGYIIHIHYTLLYV